MPRVFDNAFVATKPSRRSPYGLSWIVAIACFLASLFIARVAAAVTFTPPDGGFTYELGAANEAVCVTWPLALRDEAQCKTLGLDKAAPPDAAEQHNALVGVGLVHKDNMPFTAISSSMPRRFRVLTEGDLPRDQPAIQELATAALQSEGDIIWQSPDGGEAFSKIDHNGVAVYRIVAQQNGMAYVMFMFEHAKGTGLVQVLGPRTLYANVRLVSNEVLASLRIDPPPKTSDSGALGLASRARYAPWILFGCAVTALTIGGSYLRDRKNRASRKADAKASSTVSRAATLAHISVFFVLCALSLIETTDLVLFGEGKLLWLGRLQTLFELAAVVAAAFTLVTWPTHKHRSYIAMAVVSLVVASLLFIAMQMTSQSAG